MQFDDTDLFLQLDHDFTDFFGVQVVERQVLQVLLVLLHFILGF